MLDKSGRVFGMPSQIIHFVGIGLMVVEFVDMNLSRYPFPPLNVSKAFGTYGIAHEISVPLVLDLSKVAWILVEGGRLPGAVWIFQKRF